MPIVLTRKPAGGGDLTLIASSVLAADTAAINFTGLPQNYSHLQIVVYARTTQASPTSFVLIHLNGDTGANYDRQTVRGINVTASATVTAGQNSIGWIVPGSTAAANSFGAADILVPAYAQTIGHKAVLVNLGIAEATAANQIAAVEAYRWRNTAAITAVSLSANSGNMVAGSGIWVYGLS